SNLNYYSSAKYNTFKIDYPNKIENLLLRTSKYFFNRKCNFSYKSQIGLNRFLSKSQFDLIHVNFGTLAVQILPFAQRLKIPLIVTFHGYDASSALKRKEYSKHLDSLFKYACAIIIVSPHMIETLRLRPYINKVHSIPCGIDASYFVPLVTDHDDNSLIEILHVGRIVEKKGVPDLIRCFANLIRRYNNIRLNIVGDGEELLECRKLVIDLNLEDSVIFYGEQSQIQIRELLQRAQIFVLNSRKDSEGNMEGLPNVILEAMSMRKAIVSTVHAGIPEAIVDNFNGILVKESDNDELENGIERLIINRDIRISLGNQARKTVLDKFTADLTLTKIINIYETVTNDGSR
ncbi:MAG: glycosyltransferase family 4 protein, partial [Ferruginibacter sp.]